MNDESRAVRDAAAATAAVAWVAVGGAPAHALWCVPIEGVPHVVCGGGEQDDPGFEDGGSATVVLRGSHGGRVVEYRAETISIPPGTDEWESVASTLIPKRLNATGDVRARWTEASLWRLEAADGPVAAGGGLPGDEGAEPPRPSTATTPTRAPFRLHRVRGDRRRSRT